MLPAPSLRLNAFNRRQLPGTNAFDRAGICIVRVRVPHTLVGPAGVLVVPSTCRQSTLAIFSYPPPALPAPHLAAARAKALSCIFARARGSFQIMVPV